MNLRRCLPRFPCSLTLRSRLYALVALSIVSLIAIASLNIYSARSGTESLAAVYEGAVEPMSELSEIDQALKQIQFRMAGYVLEQLPAVGNRNQLKQAQADIVKSWAQFMSHLEPGRFTPEQAAMVRSIDRHVRQLPRMFAKIDAAYVDENPRAIFTILDEEWPFEVHATVLKPMSQLIAAEKARVQQTYQDHQRLGHRLVSLALLTLGIAIVGLAVLVTRLLRSVLKPVELAVSTARKVAAGEWDGEIANTTNDEMGELLRALAHMRDQVRHREDRLATILNNTAEGIVTFDAQGRIDGVNQAAERLFGYTERELRDKTIAFLFPPDDKENRPDYLDHYMRTEIERLVGREAEMQARRNDGTLFPCAIKVRPMLLDGARYYTALLADMSERKATLERLKRMAERDGLTGLYNRSYFLEQLDHAYERVKRAAEPCALLYIDLDNFKYINDTMGHAAGDHVLIDVAAALLRRARKSDVIARFGGDEFTVLLCNVNPEQAALAAESFHEILSRYRYGKGSEAIEVGCSIGVAVVDASAQSAAEALAHADVACHLAKCAGRNRVHRFSPADRENVASMTLDMGWSRRIRDAIENDRFVLALQPILNTRTETVEAHEVLLRMLDHDDRLIAPAAFLPAADRFGLATDIDKWVIAHAMAHLAAARQRQPNRCYHINLSAQTLGRSEVLGLIRAELDRYGLDPASLTFEVTETTAITDMATAVKFLSRLKEMGCLTALDDFGAGMASFGYLQDLPIDLVKIDGRFVKNMASNEVDRAMVRSMTEIAHAIGKRTIAEFVEDREVLALLRAFGADYAQGFAIGRPEVEPQVDAAPVAGDQVPHSGAAAAR